MDDVNVTVLMTTYNGGEFIIQAIKSVLNQTYKGFELLVIDDGSNDNTEIIIKNFQDERIKYIRIDHVGRSRALNYGLREAKYDWVALMDADDLWGTNKICEQIKLISTDNDLIFSNSVYFKKNKLSYIITNPRSKEEVIEKLALHGHFSGSNVLFNKNRIIEIGGYNEELNNCEDYELWLRIMNDFNFKFIDKIFVFNRIRINSLSRSNLNSRNKIIFTIQENYFNFSNSHLLNFSNTKKLKINGWRDYFYGDRSNVRKEWKKVNMKDWDLKMFLAFLLSYLPSNIFDIIKEKRIRITFKTRLNSITKNGRILSQEFRCILNKNCTFL
ncbi:MAG: glycosyltransferase family 2 protein [Ignavibacteriaceae bacterium]